MPNKLTAARLREVLSYDQDTGIFRWLVEPSQRNQVRVGDIAGSLCKVNGYIRIAIDGHDYRANRLAWLYVTGEWPENIVDHRDLDKANNKWTNLRPATLSQNGHNVGLRRDNQSGHKGVIWRRDCQKWAARLSGKYLGSFNEYAKACAAYDTAALEAHGEFARVA